MLKKSGWGSALASLSVLLLLVQVLTVGLIALANARTTVLASSTVQIDILPGSRDQDVQELYTSLTELSTVAAVEYIPKAKAYEQQGLAASGLANPFTDHFSVSVRSLDAFSQLVTFLSQPHWKTVVSPSFLVSIAQQQEAIEASLSVMGLSDAAATFLLIAALAALLAVLTYTVMDRLRVRQRELKLQSLLGAQEMQVMLPLILENAILLLASLIIATAGAALLVILLPMFLPTLQMTVGWGQMPMMLVFELVVLCVLCFGVTLGSARLLQVWPRPFAF